MEWYLPGAAWPGWDVVALEVPSMFSHLVGRCGVALGCPRVEDFIVVTLVSYLNLRVPALPWCKQ